MSGHTPGPWTSFGVFVRIGGHVGLCLRGPSSEANAKLIAAAPDLYRELSFVIDAEQQSCFEQWLSRVTPGGDCDSVHDQWLESSDYHDFCDLWSGPIAAIARAKGEA